MMGVEGGGRDGSASRQIEVELAAALLAGAHTSRPGVVARLQELREAWREHSRQEEARGARQGQLLREVDRVDREAARLALETARLRRLKEEAMEVVRRVEPGLLEELGYSSPCLARPLTGELLGLEPGLQEVREAVLGQGAPRLTHLLARWNILQ